jgi:inosose dehydratase
MFKREAVRFGIAPSGWSNDDMPSLGDEYSFEQCISEMALAGFEGCTVGHKFPADACALEAALKLRGLRVSEPWVGTYFTANAMEAQTLATFQRQMAFIKRMGGSVIVVAELHHSAHQQPVALLPNQAQLDDEQWGKLTQGLNTIGTIARDNGMQVVYHHHAGTGVQSRAEIDRLMAATDPDLVGLLLDTGHLFYAGEDPLEVTKAYASRIRHVHLKDVRKTVMDESIALGRSFLDSIREGVFTVPGDGVIDFRPIFDVLDNAGYEGWLLVEAEQDPGKANPLEYAMKARHYLREVTGF